MPVVSTSHQYASDTRFLQRALDQAREAASRGEVPVGAIVVAPGGATILGRGFNRNIGAHDPSAHAEIQALRQAAQALGNHRLEGCTLYVTLEPCSMCSGATLHARLARIVYVVPDDKTGAAGSVLNLFANPCLNHHTVVEKFKPLDDAGRALQQHCLQVLQDFFRQKRQAYQAQRQQPLQAPLREDALRVRMPAMEPAGHWALLGDPTAPWRMHYHDVGAGPHTVILLHGYAAQSGFWGDVPHALAQLGWHVLVPDLIGHGWSDKPKKVVQHSLGWHHALLEQWLQQLGISRCRVVAHDSAAMLAVGMLQHDSTRQALALNPEGLAWSAARGNKDWRLRCMRSPVFDLAAHWSLEGQPALDWQACHPDRGHRAAMHWSTWAARGTAIALDVEWWQQVEPALMQLQIRCWEQNDGGMRQALRHNSGWLLSTLGRPH